MWSEEDRKFMSMALELASKGLGKVNPNPMVGAVIVKEGRVTAQGWHRAYGDLHAETQALASCSEDPGGATMYVNLEPCCHQGKQPPCTDAIISAGISKVIISMKDPNPKVSGKGIKQLQDCGVEVMEGLLEEEARKLNRVFLKYISTRIPWVVLKSAMSLDGKIATSSGDSKWVSCEESRRFAHALRGRYTGIVAGIGTVMADDPMLNCRLEGMRQPLRIVVDSKARMPLNSNIVKTSREYPSVVVHTAEAEVSRLEELRKAGMQTLECKSDSQGRVDIGDMLVKLGEMSIDSLLVEGGAELNWSFVSGGFVDEYYFFLSPKIIGGSTAKGTVGGDGFSTISDTLKVEIDSVESCGDDKLIHAYKEDTCLQE